MQLHVGAGRSRLDGWVNVDLYPSPVTDMVFDLQEPWPIKNDAVTAIYGSHVLEHLPRPLDFFREAWRVLIPNGQMLLRVPYGGSRAAWTDLTHVRPWYGETFCYFQPGYAETTGNPQHDDWSAFFGVSIIQHRLRAEMAPIVSSWWRRRLVLPWFRYMGEAIEELHAHLFALKRPDDVARYAAEHVPNAVPCGYVIYRHHLDGHAVPMGGAAEVVPVAGGEGIRL